MYGNNHMFRSRPTDHHQRLLCGVPHSGSVRVFLCRAVVSRVRVSVSRVLYEPVIFGSFFFGDFLEISGDLPYGRLGFFFSAAPGNGGWPAVRVSKSSARFGSPWFLFYRLAFSVAGAFYYSCTMPMALVVWC